MQHVLLRLYRLCASFVPLVPLVYHFFCTKWYSLNVGISSKTICCTTCTTFFLFNAHGKFSFTRIFLYIKVFGFFWYKWYKVSFSLGYEAKLRTTFAFLSGTEVVQTPKSGTNPPPPPPP